ncbi:MAG: hypothetical protein JWQ02_4061 [Capsulimonas sp.]|nr:hypothetical protein [Capsulimonas sp.]
MEENKELMKNRFIKNSSLLPITVCERAAGDAAPSATYHVSIGAGALSGLGTYYVEITLTDGSGRGNGGSFASLSHFSLHGGALGAIMAPTMGDVTGALGFEDTLVLSSANAGASGLADFVQAFTIHKANATIAFHLMLTSAGVEEITPDAFSFQLLDASFTPIATTGAVGTEMIGADFNCLPLTVSGYQSSGAFRPSIVATITPVSSDSRPVAPIGIGSLSLSALLLRGSLRSRLRRARRIRMG